MKALENSYIKARLAVAPRSEWGGKRLADIVDVVLTVGDYTSKDGYRHRGGVHRVTAVNRLTGKHVRTRSYKGRTRTYYGENAWADAERLFGDVAREIERGWE